MKNEIARLLKLLLVGILKKEKSILTIQLSSNFDFGHLTLKSVIFGHPTIKTVQI
jgi:hypothetical protein